jgi:D-aspartate ligase
MVSTIGQSAAAFEVDTSTPILVLRRDVGSFQRGALAVIRSAGRLGIPVFSVRHTAREPATRSRYATGSLALSPRAPEGEWVDALIELRPKLGRGILVPIDDLAAVAVNDYQDRLAQHYALPPAPFGIQRRLASKRELWRVCQDFDIPTPYCTFPANEAELREQAAGHGYPVVVKRAERWLAPRDSAAPSVYIAHTLDQLLGAYDRMESDVAPQVMLQEYIPGGSNAVWTFNGYAGDGGECLCAFTGRRLRQQGPRTGETTLGVSAANETVEALGRRLLRNLDYRGIVDIGFHYDQRDGCYKLFDVNPRLGSSFRMFVADNGMDVLRAMHLDLTGRPVPESRITDARKWIDEPGDLATSIKLIRERALGLRSWASSLKGVEEAAWWALDDPLPFFLMAVQALPEAMRLLTGRRGQWAA